MNQRKLLLCLGIVFPLFLVTACGRVSEDEKVRVILAEVRVLQDEEAVALKELMSRENIWLGDRLTRFPENRLELEAIARQQIKTFDRILELEQTQISKLRSIRSASRDVDIATYAELQAEAFEKRLESNKLSVRRFGLILDPEINSREVLESKLGELDAAQAEIDKDIQHLDLKIAEYRNRSR